MKGPQCFVGAYVPEADARKLEELAERTSRTKSQVLRVLLRQAVAAERPDVRLGSEAETEEVEQ